VANFVLGVLSGNRHYVVQPLFLWMVGSVLGARDRSAAITRLLPAACSIVIAMGLVGIVRDATGVSRVNVTNIDSDRISSFRANSSGSIRDVAEQALERLTMWPPPAVFIASPDIVPYRWFEGFGSELAQILRISIVNGESREELFDRGLGLAPARLYGFTINQTTAVEWGLLADSWSRGGAPAAFILSLGVLGTILLIESVILRVWMLSRPTLCMLVTSFGASVAVSIEFVPGTATIRTYLLSLPLIFAIWFVADLAGSRRGIKGRKVIAPSDAYVGTRNPSIYASLR
jgi:hypothetical protein